MRKKSAIFAAAILACLLSVIGFAGGTDPDVSGRDADIRNLWKDYEAAVSADRPQTQMEILEKIISKSFSGRQNWDFYDAWQKKVETGSSRNWKLYDSLCRARDEAYRQYNDGIISVVTGNRDFEAVKAAYSSLSQSRSAKFFESGLFWGAARGSEIYSPLLAKIIKNDYEFALWYLMGVSDEDDRAREEIFKSAGTVSLQASFADFDRTIRTTDTLSSTASRLECLEKYSARWSSSVSSLMAEEGILTLRLDALLLQKNPASADFRKLRDDCVLFEKKRNSFKGDEKLLADRCTIVKALMNTMDAEDLNLKSDSSSVTIYFQNVKEAELTLSYKEGGKETDIYTEKFSNPVCSYFAVDSLVVPVPVKDDGAYKIKAEGGQCLAECRINRYSISAAVSKDDRGWTVYAADYDSGKPLEKYDVKLYASKDDCLVAACENFCQKEGLSPLPSDFAAKINPDGRRGQYIVCSYIDDQGNLHRSEPLSIYESSSPAKTSVNGLNAVIFTDCGAYHRGDAIHFKTVAYTGSYLSEMAVAARNTPLTAVLYDPDGNVLERKKLKTNEFGSAAAEFVIPTSVKGGRAGLSVEKSDGTTLASRYVTVDDYVLPDFECVFDKIDSMFFVGDTVTVKGRVKAYSGHNVKVSRAYFSVAGTEGTQKVDISQDGTFSMRVPTPKYRYWNSSVTLTVNLSSGETHEFTKNIPVGQYLDLRVTLDNEVKASVEGRTNYISGNDGADRYCSILRDNSGIFSVEAFNSEQLPQEIQADFKLFRSDSLLNQGTVRTPGKVNLELPDRDGEYEVWFEASVKDGAGRTISRKICWQVIKLQPGARSLDADVENVFVPLDDGNIGFTLAATRGPVWAVVMLYGPAGQVLHNSLMHLEGRRGMEDSVSSLSIPFGKSLPGNVRMSVFYFRKGKFHKWEHAFKRGEGKKKMNLAIARFCDAVAPGTEYSFTLQANPGSEVAVAIFDKSTETISQNFWTGVSGSEEPFIMPYLFKVTGEMSGTPYRRGPYPLTKTESVRIWGSSPLTNAVAVNDDAAIPFQMVEEKPVMMMSSDELLSAGGDVRLRVDFATTLCWQPQIKLPSSGETVVKFKTSDKTGKFVVNVFAHDKSMANAVMRREMTVSLPVELSVSQPSVLYEGDRYVVRATVSTLGEDVAGTLVLDAGKAGSFAKDVKIEKGSAESFGFAVDVPSDMDNLPFRLVFSDAAGRYSDAVAFTVPVRSSIQTLTESHSAVVPDGDSRDKALEKLAGQFVNTTPNGAQISEIRILDMVRDVIAGRTEPSGESVLDLTDALSANMMCASFVKIDSASLNDLALDLAEFHNEDGGFAWIKGMASSPVVTAALLERNVRVEGVTGEGFLSREWASKAVSYLDSAVFSPAWNYGKWCSWSQGISLHQYLYVRSFYPQVDFAVKFENEKKKDSFVSAAEEYLFPAKDRGLNGRVFAKVLRLSTLENIYGLEEGPSLLKVWGIGPFSTKKVLQSLEADVESLKEYAVNHDNGGVYYPNLVMPYRGILSDEAYCHSLLSDLMANYDREISDGICLWLMLQKETQKWDSNFAFVNAAASILRGSDALKFTSVLTMTKSFEKPYREIKAEGNGFSITREFYRKDAAGKEYRLSEGDVMHPGDRIEVRYHVSNAENRSFVRITAPHFGCLRPVNQISGRIVWWLRPMSFSGGVFSPQGYREVRSDRTVYWFDTYPEAESDVTEEYFVVQEGLFTAPVVTIESLYAPHYRANGAFDGEIESKE